MFWYSLKTSNRQTQNINIIISYVKFSFIANNPKNHLKFLCSNDVQQSI